jgi:hypothetical protein
MGVKRSLILREEPRLRVLRRIFGPKRDEVAGECRKLHNEELNDLLFTKYYSSDQISKNETCGVCSTYGARRGVLTRFWWGNLRERDHLENRGLGGRIILRWIFRN